MSCPSCPPPMSPAETVKAKRFGVEPLVRWHQALEATVDGRSSRATWQFFLAWSRDVKDALYAARDEVRCLGHKIA